MLLDPWHRLLLTMYSHLIQMKEIPLLNIDGNIPSFEQGGAREELDIFLADQLPCFIKYVLSRRRANNSLKFDHAKALLF